jgi:hypothetical protein
MDVEFNMRWKATLTARQHTVYIEFVCQSEGKAVQIAVPRTADGKWGGGIAGNRDMEAEPDEAVGVEGRHGPLTVFGDGPGAVVEVGIGPAELAAGIVAEVVADRSDERGLLSMTSQP